MAGGFTLRRSMRKFSRSILRSRFAVWLLSGMAIAYLNLIYRTNRYIVVPEDSKEAYLAHGKPVIVAIWHGQHLMLPVIPIDMKATAMISRNFDGDVMARIVTHFGNSVVRALEAGPKSHSCKREA